MSWATEGAGNMYPEYSDGSCPINKEWDWPDLRAARILNGPSVATLETLTLHWHSTK